MIFYNEYLKALLDANSEQEERFKERKSEVDTEYDRNETRIKSTYQTKLNNLHNEKKKTLNEIENKKSQLIRGDNSRTLSGELRDLVEKRDSLREHCEELERLAIIKSNKRKEVRSKLWKFWWKS